MTTNFEELQSYLKVQKTHIAQIANRVDEIEEKKTITLFKLPAVYGEIPDGQFDFEWPKKEDLMGM